MRNAIGEAFQIFVGPAQRVLRLAHPQEGFDGGHQNCRIQRFNQIPVRAGVQTVYLLLLLNAGCRNMQDGRGGQRGIRPDAPADLESVHVGKIDVQKNHGRLTFRHQLRRLAAGGCLNHIEASLPQDIGARVQPRRIVVDVEYGRYCVSTGCQALLEIAEAGSPTGLTARRMTSAISSCPWPSLLRIARVFPANCTLSGSVRTREVQITTGMSLVAALAFQRIQHFKPTHAGHASDPG